MTNINQNFELNPLEHGVQSRTLKQRQEQAVCVRHAHKRYGTKKNPFVVLDDLNMTVPKGCIYGLLGASGCGKTTLLGCIVGRKRLNSGEIWVLGGKPGSIRSGVPGPRVGYMPQELALFGEFTIRETLHYFGLIANMKNKQIETRLDFLLNLLMLPDADKFVGKLSGGQQRRVSLASAFIHEPELLILDEPTVGVDPLLRQIIWDHLVDITKMGRTTVIITTHYIDETRQAHLIGLMRGGYFLAEERPDKLLSEYGANTLEDVFLKLSIKQNLIRQRNSSIQQRKFSIVLSNGVVDDSVVIDDVDSSNQDEISGEFGDFVSQNTDIKSTFVLTPPLTLPHPIEQQCFGKTSSYLLVIKEHHLRALVWVNLLWMWRNLPVMCFLILLPVIQNTIFCTSIGHDPINLPIAVINYETNNDARCNSSITCDGMQLSCNYLEYLEKRALLLIYYETEVDAMNSVVKGETYASIVVRQNYSAALKARIQDWQYAAPWNIEASEIDVIRDLTSKDIANYLKVYLYDSFQTFIQDYLTACQINKQVISIPFKWENPVYGLVYPNFTDFATPGIILTITFFLAVALTAGAMVIQRKEGSTERALIIGVTPIELLLAHIICQFIIMVIQTTLVLLCSFVLFKMTMNGSILLVILLTLLTGFCGMCFGFTISCAVDSERMATFFAMGSFFPLVMLSGIVWPIEAMHYLLQLLSFFLPLTKATESLRSILQRGWGLSMQIVYMGFISIIIWIIIFLALTIILLKFKKG